MANATIAMMKSTPRASPPNRNPTNTVAASRAAGGSLLRAGKTRAAPETATTPPIRATAQTAVWLSPVRG
jgi:hypothetical protein